MKGLLKTYRSAVIFGSLCALILLLLSVAVNVETTSAEFVCFNIAPVIRCGQRGDNFSRPTLRKYMDARGV